MNSIVKINASEYGLENKKASQISDMFKPMLDKMVELETEYNQVVKLPVDEKTCKIAKDLRLKYVKIRTGTASIHKELKQFYLQGGRFVDGWKNAQLMASQGIESKLSDIEKHFKNIEKEKIVKLQTERENALLPFELDYIPHDLGTMKSEVWDNFISGVELNFKQKKEAEEKAERERIAKEKAEREEQERIKKENARLKKEAEEKERIAKIEAEKRAEIERKRIELERKAKAEQEAKERRVKEEYEAKLKAEREAREKQIAEERRIREEKERIEREAREKIERELRKKQEVEARAKADEELKIQQELNKGDTQKINDLIANLDDLKNKFVFKSNKNIKLYSSVGDLLDKVINFIRSK